MHMNWQIFFLNAATVFFWFVCGWVAGGLFRDFQDRRSEDGKVWKPSNRRL